MFTTLTSALKLSVEEYFKNIEEIPETPDEIKAYIPTLMPLIPMGDPKTDIKETIDRSIFCNAKDCSVTNTPTIINTQNFITLKPYPNEFPNFRQKAIFKDGVYKVPKGEVFLLSVVGEDLEGLYFTGKS